MTPEDSDEFWELSDEEIADVEVFTTVRADELRFESVPETNVSFEGEPAERSSSKTERDNLPDEVEAGVTYRNIEVRWQARSRIVHPSDPSGRRESSG
jgi:hypothetical protein